MRYLENERAYWITTFQGKIQLLHSTCQEQRHHLYARNSWERWISPSYSGIDPQFQLFGTSLPNNLNASGSAVCIHKNLFPEGAIVTHVGTCQGRHHIVNHNLFEPDLTLRNLRERQRLTTLHWPRYPEPE